MKFIAGLLGMGLTLALSLWVTSFVLDRTLFNSKAFGGYVAETKLATTLSDQLPKLMTRSLPKENQEPAQKLLREALTPEYIQSKLGPTVTQSLDYYIRGKGEVPTLDLRDFKDQAKKVGIELPDHAFAKPLPLTGEKSESLTRGFGYYDQARTVTLFISVISFVILLVLCWHMRRFSPLVSALVTVGFTSIFTGLSVVYLTPRLVKLLPIEETTARDFASTILDFFTVVTQDMSMWYLWLGGSIMALALIVLTTGILIKRKYKPEEEKALAAKKLAAA